MAYRRRIEIKLSSRYYQALSQILHHTHTLDTQFTKAILHKEIRCLSRLFLSVEIDRSNRTRLYEYWTINNALKADSYSTQADKPLITKAISLFGWDNIIQAIDTYAEIVHHPESFMMYPVSRLEEWILNDITGFLPGAALDPYVKYARPADVKDHKILDAVMGDDR